MIKIDFHGSTHGRLLEYVSNVYIMQTNPGSGDLFNANGASHAVDATYLKNRQIKSGHFSSSNAKFKDTDQVIRITIDPTDDRQFFIALTSSCVMYFLISGYESVTLLSQYIGERKPLVQVKGSSTFNFTALHCNK